MNSNTNNKTRSNKPLISAIILAVILIGASILWFHSSMARAPLSFYTVQKGSIAEQVQSTGIVKAADNVALSFEKSARIVAVNAQAGDEVVAGQILAQLDSSDVVAQLAQANANITAQNAKLNELQQGARPEQIQIDQTNIASAQSALNNAQKALASTISDAYVKSDDAVHNKADALFNNPRTPNPKLSVTVNDFNLESQTELSRVVIEKTLSDWNTALAGISSTTSSGASLAQVTASTAQSENSLNQVKSFLDQMASVVNSLTASASTPQATIDGYKLSISTARTTISASLSGLVAAESAFKNAQSALTLAQNQLTLAQAGGVTDDIKAQQAQVAQAEASVQNLQSALAKTAIRAPFSGKVTEQDAKVGQIAVPNSPVISLISDTQFQVETYIPENDITKSTVGDSASVTLDAYGNSVNFPAKVVAIDPAETVINGVASYKVTLQFAQNDDRIKSGMTANVSTNSATESANLIIPAQSVVNQNNESYVMLATGVKNGNTAGAKLTLQKIVTGKESSDGMIEVISGLNAGDQIANF